MKMITLSMTILADDDAEAEDVSQEIERSIDHLKEYDDQTVLQKASWFEVSVESDRPYAKEA